MLRSSKCTYVNYGDILHAGLLVFISMILTKKENLEAIYVFPAVYLIIKVSHRFWLKLTIAITQMLDFYFYTLFKALGIKSKTLSPPHWAAC